LKYRYRQTDENPTLQSPNRTPHAKTTNFSGSNHLCLGGDTALGVGDLDAESLGLGDDVDTLAGGDGVGDPGHQLDYTFKTYPAQERENILGSVGAVVHQEELDILGVVDEEGLVARGHEVAGLLVAAVTDGGHGNLALEAAADGIVNTLGLAPRLRHALEPVRLVTVEARDACCEKSVSLPELFLHSTRPVQLDG
jgi:hypothetical protein